jgi:hypothetical protein
VSAGVCDDRFALEDRLWGSADRGVWLGHARADGGPVLVTLGPPPRDHPGDDAPAVPGVTPWLAAGDGPDGSAALVEARPPGTVATPADARAAGATVAALAAGHVLGGLRPEAIWIDGGGTLTLAPRAVPFWERGRSDAGLVPATRTEFRSPERLRGAGAPSAADDVFALAATVVVWLTGEHPFAGDTHDDHVRAIVLGERAARTGDPVLEAALGPASGRPSMRELGAALRDEG